MGGGSELKLTDMPFYNLWVETRVNAFKYTVTIWIPDTLFSNFGCFRAFEIIMVTVCCVYLSTDGALEMLILSCVNLQTVQAKAV
jgi:hypothetical protein